MAMIAPVVTRRLIRDIAGGWPVPDRPMKRRVMASPPTPTWTNAITISSPRTIHAGKTDAFHNSGPFTYSRAGALDFGPSFPLDRTARFHNVSYNSTLESNGYMVSFVHTG